jgi:hypothetical protein
MADEIQLEKDRESEKLDVQKKQADVDALKKAPNVLPDCSQTAKTCVAEALQEKDSPVMNYNTDFFRYGGNERPHSNQHSALGSDGVQSKPLEQEGGIILDLVPDQLSYDSRNGHQLPEVVHANSAPTLQVASRKIASRHYVARSVKSNTPDILTQEASSSKDDLFDDSFLPAGADPQHSFLSQRTLSESQGHSGQSQRQTYAKRPKKQPITLGQFTRKMPQFENSTKIAVSEKEHPSVARNFTTPRTRSARGISSSTRRSVRKELTGSSRVRSSAVPQTPEDDSLGSLTSFKTPFKSFKEQPTEGKTAVISGSNSKTRPVRTGSSRVRSSAVPPTPVDSSLGSMKSLKTPSKASVGRYRRNTALKQLHRPAKSQKKTRKVKLLGEALFTSLDKADPAEEAKTRFSCQGGVDG